VRGAPIQRGDLGQHSFGGEEGGKNTALVHHVGGAHHQGVLDLPGKRDLPRTIKEGFPFQPRGGPLYTARKENF